MARLQFGGKSLAGGFGGRRVRARGHISWWLGAALEHLPDQRVQFGDALAQGVQFGIPRPAAFAYEPQARNRVDRAQSPGVHWGAMATAAAGTLVHRPDSYVDRLELARLFERPQPLEIELGAGDGSFLLEWARLHPQRNFIGVERLLGRLRKLDRKARRAGLRNLRLIRLEAGYFLKYLVPPGFVQALHIYFPDPWPKRKHWRHRLVNPAFAEVSARALMPAGEIYLRTDSPEYYAQMQSAFGAHPRFESLETPAELSAMLTDFERAFQAQGILTLRAAFRRLAG